MVHRRRAAVLRLDIAAAVSSTARGLGPQGHAGYGADHRCERQAGAVRRDQPADCAPGRAHPSTCRRRRCPGILARDTTPLPRRRHDLAPRRPGQRTHRCAHPEAGRSARHPVSLVAQAGSGTERHGPTLARTEAAHRCQSAGRLGGCSGQQRRGLGAGTDTPAGAPQGRDDIAALLAQEPGTRLLATYLVLGILGILLSLALLMYLAYRGVNVLLLAPIMALLALVFNAGPDPALMLGTYTQFYMAEFGKYLAKFFPLFMLGALFGKLMDDSGCARVIAHRIVAFTGKSRAILAVVLACGVLTYGGVSLFVVAFAVYPIARQLFREADIPKRLIPACIAAGSFTFTMTALPGTPAIQNAIPAPYFGTNTFAAPGLGTIAGALMFAGSLAWLSWRAARARAASEGYGSHAD